MKEIVLDDSKIEHGIFDSQEQMDNFLSRRNMLEEWFIQVNGDNGERYERLNGVNTKDMKIIVYGKGRNYPELLKFDIKCKYCYQMYKLLKAMYGKKILIQIREV